MARVTPDRKVETREGSVKWRYGFLWMRPFFILPEQKTLKRVDRADRFEPEWREE